MKAFVFLLPALLAIACTHHATKEEDRYFRLDGNGIDWVNELIPDADGGVLLIGYTSSSDLSPTYSGDWDGLLVKLDSNWNQTWIKTFGGHGVDAFVDGVKTKNGWVISGYRSIEGLQKQAWILGVNHTGEVIWEQIIGGKGNDEAFAIDRLEEDIVVCGFSDSDSTSLWGNGNQYKGLMMRLSADGNVIWNSNIQSEFNHYLTDVVTVDGACIAGGFSFHSDSAHARSALAVSFSKNGDLVWQKNYPHQKNTVVSSLAYNGDSLLLVGTEKRNRTEFWKAFSIECASGTAESYASSSTKGVLYDGLVTEKTKILTGRMDTHTGDSVAYHANWEGRPLNAIVLPNLFLFNAAHLCIIQQQNKLVFGTVSRFKSGNTSIEIYERRPLYPTP